MQYLIPYYFQIISHETTLCLCLQGTDGLPFNRDLVFVVGAGVDSYQCHAWKKSIPVIKTLVSLPYTPSWVHEVRLSTDEHHTFMGVKFQHITKHNETKAKVAITSAGFINSDRKWWEGRRLLPDSEETWPTHIGKYFPNCIYVVRPIEPDNEHVNLWDNQ